MCGCATTPSTRCRWGWRCTSSTSSSRLCEAGCAPRPPCSREETTMIEKLNGTTETVDFKVSSTTRLYHNHTAEDFPLHWHVPGEIICPIENTYQVTIAGQALTLLPHDVLIIASGELHSITAPPSGERYIVNFSNSF